jgi:hypothetical protein
MFRGVNHISRVIRRRKCLRRACFVFLVFLTVAFLVTLKLMWNGWWLYWFLERRFYEHQIKCARHHHHFQN